jgi:hypothetical protein
MPFVWTPPPLWTADLPISVNRLNQQVGQNGNMDYLFNRPMQVIKRTAGANLTTSSTTFVDMDAVNLAITLANTLSGKILFGANIPNSNSLGAFNTSFDVVIDGTSYTAAGGFSWAAPTTSVGQGVLFGLANGLSVASHTLKLQWKAAGGTSTAYITSPWEIIFWAWEVS